MSHSQVLHEFQALIVNGPILIRRFDAQLVSLKISSSYQLKFDLIVDVCVIKFSLMLKFRARAARRTTTFVQGKTKTRPITGRSVMSWIDSGASLCSGQHIIIDGNIRRLVNTQCQDHMEETDAFRSYWDPSNYESWRDRQIESRHRSMRSSSSLNRCYPQPHAMRRIERRVHNVYAARAYLSWKDWLRQNASGPKNGGRPTAGDRRQKVDHRL
ncbi:hypothetical protein Pmar_PMAR016426 [Perkinsus marinus ATCC 50983]|uniref:Uncharacterized protein n=1 Tax=Perkinsus marinus (strain ATCC 50983 / TXsc) TaxID=423536 RepID=C5L188_PERM5|nr:hypothetical protein Pmar_PMAR016426 [Perkinsus marinus ATCC 50983]EER09495.1 hypothetical protein Pmar_PMAR016426 [Perkinsus marinus ATCC 50983]|eukprot:XP_002777679.1 hypothetical protein Pmar_PMAR016426 [Perkinsus marinus ATCC 50983]